MPSYRDLAVRKLSFFFGYQNISTMPLGKNKTLSGILFMDLVIHIDKNVQT